MKFPQDHKLENGILFIDHVQVSSPDSKTIVFTHSSNGEITLKINEGKILINLKSEAPSEHQFMKEDDFGFLFHRFLLGMCQKEILRLLDILHAFTKYLIAHRIYFKSADYDIFVIDSKKEMFMAKSDDCLYALEYKKVKSELFESFMDKCLCKFSFCLLGEFRVEASGYGESIARDDHEERFNKLKRFADSLLAKIENLKTFPSFQFMSLIEPRWISSMDQFKNLFHNEIQEKAEREKFAAETQTIDESCL